MTSTATFDKLSVPHTLAPVDTVIIGGGIAGLSAALFLARAGRSVIVYDAGRSRILAVERVHEYVGFDGWPPEEVLTKARQEILHYGGIVRNGVVDRVDVRPDGLFDVLTQGDVTTARTVVLATGLVDELPAIKGVPKIWGRDLRICPCFDGYEVRNQRFVVFGLPERVVQLGSWVSMWSRDVTVISKERPEGAGAERLRLLGIRVIQDEVSGLLHRGNQLAAVATEGGVEIPCDAAWIATRLRAASKLAASLCEVDVAGFAKTDENGRTSRPGVFAVGNATNPLAHLAHAAASGTHAGPWITMYLLEEFVRRVEQA